MLHNLSIRVLFFLRNRLLTLNIHVFRLILNWYCEPAEKHHYVLNEHIRFQPLTSFTVITLLHVQGFVFRCTFKKRHGIHLVFKVKHVHCVSLFNLIYHFYDWICVLKSNKKLVTVTESNIFSHKERLIIHSTETRIWTRVLCPK